MLSCRFDATLSNSISSGQAITFVVTADILYGTPIFLRSVCYVQALIVSVTAASAGNLRVGLYYDSNGYPGAKVFTEAEITSAGTTGLKRQNVGLTLPMGWYWAATQYSSTPTMQGDVGLTANFPATWLGATNVDAELTSVGITVADTYGVLPDPFTAGAALATTNLPRVLMMTGRREPGRPEE